METIYAQKNDTVQKASANNAESVVDSSSQSATLQRHAALADVVAQRAPEPRPNLTGMPDNLKSGIESLSGYSMDDVRVHYNSDKPATVQALAYTQGTDIHVAPGQEHTLPHEAWHVAQQMAGRVSPTTNINGMPVNDNAGLEHEADVMGEKAVTQKFEKTLQKKNVSAINVQCIFKLKFHYGLVYNAILNSVRKMDDFNLPKESYDLQILNGLMQLLQDYSEPITEKNWNEPPGAMNFFNELYDSADKDRIKLKEHSQETVAGETNTALDENEDIPTTTPVNQEIDDAKITRLKKCPLAFNGITLFHGDNRDYLLNVGISPINTSLWETLGVVSPLTKESLLQKGQTDQEAIVDKVWALPETKFADYISTWIRGGFGEPLIQPFGGRFNGWCCSMTEGGTRGTHKYKITLNDSFVRTKSYEPGKKNGSALYRGLNSGIILQFARPKSDTGEVDILSTIRVSPTTNPNVCQSEDGTVILTKL